MIMPPLTTPGVGKVTDSDICATCSGFGSIELQFGPEVTEYLMNGFRQRPRINHLNICLTEDEREIEPILPSALHFLGECLPAIPDLEIQLRIDLVRNYGEIKVSRK